MIWAEEVWFRFTFLSGCKERFSHEARAVGCFSTYGRGGAPLTFPLERGVRAREGYWEQAALLNPVYAAQVELREKLLVRRPVFQARVRTRFHDPIQELHD